MKKDVELINMLHFSNMCSICMTLNSISCEETVQMNCRQTEIERDH